MTSDSNGLGFVCGACYRFNMRILPLILGILFSLNSTSASEIREFSVPTLERLGAELSRRDAMAARASDLVLAQHPELKKGPLLESDQSGVR